MQMALLSMSVVTLLFRFSFKQCKHRNYVIGVKSVKGKVAPICMYMKPVPWLMQQCSLIQLQKSK